jgi:catechol 2,3-dioxygenase-like lactoylglutathione lyase family enzyme
MITYREIAFTAYAVTNMAKARKFYEGVLCLKPARKLGPKFVEYDIGRRLIFRRAGWWACAIRMGM